VTLNAGALGLQPETAAALFRCTHSVIADEFHLSSLAYHLPNERLEDDINVSVSICQSRLREYLWYAKSDVAMKTLMTTGQAAQRLGVSDSRIRQLILDGKLAAVKAGRDWLIKASDLRRLERRKTKPGPAAKK